MEKKPTLQVKATKLTEWRFSIPVIDGKNKNISVEVRLMSDKEGLRMRAIVQDRLVEPIEDTDISNLYTKVESALLALNMGTRIEWQDYLQIKVAGNGVNKTFITSEHNFQRLSVDVERVKYGLHPDTLEPYILDRQGYPTRVHKAPQMFQGKVWDHDGAQTSYIPDTPENVAAMDEVCARMNTLKDRLSEVLNQDNLQSTLEIIRNSRDFLALENKGE